MNNQFRWRGKCTPTQAIDMTARLYTDGWENISSEQVGDSFLITASKPDAMAMLGRLSNPNPVMLSSGEYMSM